MDGRAFCLFNVADDCVLVSLNYQRIVGSDSDLSWFQSVSGCKIWTIFVFIPSRFGIKGVKEGWRKKYGWIRFKSTQKSFSKFLFNCFAMSLGIAGPSGRQSTKNVLC